MATGGWRGNINPENPLVETSCHMEMDVVVMGGALAGASAAMLLLREHPGLRVLVVEKNRAFQRRVGEATVEFSGYFLIRVLGLAEHLNQEHLVKQGLRFWMTHDKAADLSASSEIGGQYLARVPAFQVDRAVLDEEVLRQAVAEGVKLWRPAAVQDVVLQEGGEQELTVRRGERTVKVRARWVIDATGVAAMLARRQGWWQAQTEHPITAVWTRWKGVKNLDGLALRRRYPAWSQAAFGLRQTATNHLMGDGWWAWVIPLKGGDVSAGVVFDQRLVDWPREGSLGGRLKEFLCRHPVGRELFGEAQWAVQDVHLRRQLAYQSSRYAGDGFALVGDASAFMDPFYSPGLDWLAMTVTAAVSLIGAQRRGEEMARLVARHNDTFRRSYQRWFDAVYRDKYQYLGDFELLKLAFLLDLGFYYLGVASQPYKRGEVALREPLFSLPPAIPVYHLMKTYNRRLARMAESRRQRGTLGRRNVGERFMFGGYTFRLNSSWPLIKALLGWGRLELAEGWRTWFSRSKPASKPGATLAKSSQETVSTA